MTADPPEGFTRMDKSSGSAKQGKARRALFYSLFCLHKAIRIPLTLLAWLFLVHFLLQFVHARKDGKSLPERVQMATAIVQIPIEEAARIDMRYEFRNLQIDLMPLVLVTGFFLIRWRTSSIYKLLESKLKGTTPEPVLPGSWSPSRAATAGSRPEPVPAFRARGGGEPAAGHFELYSFWGGRQPSRG